MLLGYTRIKSRTNGQQIKSFLCIVVGQRSGALGQFLMIHDKSCCQIWITSHFWTFEEFKRFGLFKWGTQNSRINDPMVLIFSLFENILEFVKKQRLYLISQPFWAFKTRLSVSILIVRPNKSKRTRKRKTQSSHCSSIFLRVCGFGEMKGGPISKIIGNKYMRSPLYIFQAHPNVDFRLEQGKSRGFLTVDVYQTCPKRRWWENCNMIWK